MKSILLLVVFAFLTVNAQSVLVVDQYGGGQYITINAALAVAAAGDTIKVMPGLYLEYLNLTKKVHLLGMDTTAILDYNGNGVILFSVDGASVQGFKIRRNININNGYKNILLASNIIDSASVTANLGNGGAVVMNNKIRKGLLTVSNSGTEKIIVLNNEFSGAAANSTIITAIGKVIIYGNKILDGGTGVNAGNDVKIIGNILKNNQKHGVFISPAINGTIANVAINSNKFSDGANHGILLYNGENRYDRAFQNINILNNSFTNIAKAVEYQGGAYYNSQHYSNVTSRFANNVLVGCQYGIYLQWAFSPSSLIKVHNNIVVNSSSTAFTPSTVTQNDYNCFYNNPVNVFPGTGNLNANPMFSNQAGEDYSLQSGSPCIDAGSPLPQDYEVVMTWVYTEGHSLG